MISGIACDPKRPQQTVIIQSLDALIAPRSLPPPDGLRREKPLFATHGSGRTNSFKEHAVRGADIKLHGAAASRVYEDQGPLFGRRELGVFLRRISTRTVLSIESDQCLIELWRQLLSRLFRA